MRSSSPLSRMVVRSGLQPAHALLVLSLKNMLNIQISFFRQLCHLRKSVTPPIIFREFAERPWLHTWWSQVLGFMRRLLSMPHDSLHVRHSQRIISQMPGCSLLAVTGPRALHSNSAALGWSPRSRLQGRRSRQPWFHDQAGTAATSCVGGPS